MAVTCTSFTNKTKCHWSHKQVTQHVWPQKKMMAAFICISLHIFIFCQPKQTCAYYAFQNQPYFSKGHESISLLSCNNMLSTALGSMKQNVAKQGHAMNSARLKSLWSVRRYKVNHPCLYSTNVEYCTPNNEKQTIMAVTLLIYLSSYTNKILSHCHLHLPSIIEWQALLSLYLYTNMYTQVTKICVDLSGGKE